MPSVAARPSLRRVACLLAVALWLGWTGMGLARLHRLPDADPLALETALARLPDTTIVPGQPLAVLLASSCACQDDRTAWSAIGQVVSAHGGRLLELPASDGPDAGIALLVLDARGRPVYSGPLSPPPGACGPGRASPGTWLPLLLDGRQPPLHLGSPPCPC